MKVELMWESIKAVPAVLGAWYAAVTLNQIVAFVTLLYVTIQAAYLLRKWYREEQEWAHHNSPPSRL